MSNPYVSAGRERPVVPCATGAPTSAPTHKAAERAVLRPRRSPVLCRTHEPRAAGTRCLGTTGAKRRYYTPSAPEDVTRRPEHEGLPNRLEGEPAALR